MITWVTLVLVIHAYQVARCVMRGRGHYRTPAEQHAALATIVFTIIPALYAVGWLFLPAWGIGPKLQGF